MTTAIDNIDHDPTSTSAETSFHGTSISVFQHPCEENSNEKIFEFEESDRNIISKPRLPEYYTNILPVKENKPEYPKTPASFLYNNGNEPEESLKIEEWLTKLASGKDSEDDRISFSAFHSKSANQENVSKDTSVLLPLLNDSVNSPAMVFHCLQLISNLTNHLNPVQNPVITAD